MTYLSYRYIIICKFSRGIFSRVISLWTVDKMLTNGLLFLMFVLSLLSCYTQAFLKLKDMNWKKNPAEAWPYTLSHIELKAVIFLLNIDNYLDNGKEYTFIASGVLLDNSRILTSYNPFRQLIDDPNITEHILALLPVGYKATATLKIANIVCGRQITDDPILPENNIWRDKEHSPIHDLMIVRLEEEIGIAGASYRQRQIVLPDSHKGHDFYFAGQFSQKHYNAVISLRAKITDSIEPEVMIFTLGYESKKQMREFDTIHVIDYEAEDDVLVDCEEWLPRQWGFFICIRNIGDFPGLGSGAALYSDGKLFGIGTFAMFKEDLGILVFTDVRPYEELIEKTCGDEEFL